MIKRGLGSARHPLIFEPLGLIREDMFYLVISLKANLIAYTEGFKRKQEQIPTEFGLSDICVAVIQSEIFERLYKSGIPHNDKSDDLYRIGSKESSLGPVIAAYSDLTKNELPAKSRDKEKPTKEVDSFGQLHASRFKLCKLVAIRNKQVRYSSM